MSVIIDLRQRNYEFLKLKFYKQAVEYLFIFNVANILQPLSVLIPSPRSPIFKYSLYRAFSSIAFIYKQFLEIFHHFRYSK